MNTNLYTDNSYNNCDNDDNDDDDDDDDDDDGDDTNNNSYNGNDVDDLVNVFLLENLVSPKSENKNQVKGISEINNVALIDNLKASIKDKLNILQGKRQDKCAFMEYEQQFGNYSYTLNVNKQIISSLLDLKRNIVFALQKCEQKLVAVEKSLEKYTTSSAKILTCNAGIPYFKDKRLFFAFSNRDEILKKERKELQLRNIPKVSSWTKKERYILLKAIEKETSINVDTEMTERMYRKRKQANILLSVPCSIEKIALTGEKKFDWLQISSTYFEDIHSPLDCCVMWNVFLHPSINKNCWTKLEDMKLKKIAEKYKFQNWNKIAKELNTNRSAYQCFVRYNTTKKLPKIKNCTWENCEDERLLKLINIFQIGDYVPWGEVANWMQNRTKQQTYYRWTYSLAPYLTKGRFTKAEDNILKDAINKFGTNFRKISVALMPNRSSVQLHDRYQTLTMNQIKNWNLWTFEEDTKLLDLFRHVGPNWSTIAKEFSYKTRIQLRHRYATLQKYIKRGISLFELHKNDHFSLNNPNEKQEPLKVNSHNNSFFTSADNETGKRYYDNNIDKQLIDHFRTEYKIERFLHKCKFYRLERLNCRNTVILCSILQALNAKLNIPNDNDDDDDNGNEAELRDERRLFSSFLREYIRTKNDKRDNSRVIDKYRTHMFGSDETQGECSHFIPPPPFNLQIKFVEKSKRSQCIDYNIDINNKFLLEESTTFHTLDPVISYIGGDEEELQFQKLTNIFRTGDSKNEQLRLGSSTRTLSQQCVSNTYNRNNSNSMMEFISWPNIRIASFANHNNDNLQDGYYKISCEQTREQVDSLHMDKLEKLCIPVIHATHATLFSLKNLMYLKRLNEMYNTPDQLIVQLQPPNKPSIRKVFDLLEVRLEQLFKYPIGLSKTVLPEIHVTDIFSYSHVISKRKTCEISDTSKNYKRKKVIT